MSGGLFEKIPGCGCSLAILIYFDWGGLCYVAMCKGVSSGVIVHD